MADVARRAGVSTMTVSRALKGGRSVKEETRTRIMRAVDELGYVLDLTAGALSSKRSGFVSVLIPSVNNSNFSETVHGISDVLSEDGTQILVGYTDYSKAQEQRLIETMLRRRPEGVIVTGGVHTEGTRELLEQAAIPVIETWDMPADPIGHVVGFSNAATIEDMMARLLFRGYRKIGFIGGDDGRANGSDDRGRERRLGYERAVAALGLETSHVVPVGDPPVSIEHGGRAVVRLVEEWPDVEAAICVSDLPAFGAIMECHRREWAVPGRLAIAGFGDFEISRFCWPTITTVSVSCTEIGRKAGHLMSRAIKGARSEKPLPPQSVVIPHSIIEREST